MKCFLLPQADAKAVLADGPLQGPRVSDVCESLRVQAGTVRLIYTDADAMPITEDVAAGAAPALVGAAGEAAAFATVASESRLGARRDVGLGGVGLKKYQADKPTPLHFGLPAGAIHVPAGGLQFRIKAPVLVAGQAPVRLVELVFRITDATGNKVYAEGRGAPGFVVAIPAEQLPAGAKFRVRVRASLPENNIDAASDAEVIAGPRARELEQRMAKALAPLAGDALAMAIAQALVYEDEGLTFNMRNALEGVRP